MSFLFLTFGKCFVLFEGSQSLQSVLEGQRHWKGHQPALVPSLCHQSRTWGQHSTECQSEPGPRDTSDSSAGAHGAQHQPGKQNLPEKKHKIIIPNSETLLQLAVMKKLGDFYVVPQVCILSKEIYSVFWTEVTGNY